MRTQIPRLSKSRFMAGLQCHRRLYLELYAPEIAADLDETTVARFGVGTAVGELARQRFAGGRLIAHGHEHHADAEAETRALLDDPDVPALYEAAFSYDDVAVRADIIARQRAREFDLIEVKSTARWKEPRLFDLAVQLLSFRAKSSPACSNGRRNANRHADMSVRNAETTVLQRANEKPADGCLTCENNVGWPSVVIER
jgi:hypothetical protein